MGLRWDMDDKFRIQKCLGGLGVPGMSPVDVFIMKTSSQQVYIHRLSTDFWFVHGQLHKLTSDAQLLNQTCTDLGTRTVRLCKIFPSEAR